MDDNIVFYHIHCRLQAKFVPEPWLPSKHLRIRQLSVPGNLEGNESTICSYYYY